MIHPFWKACNTHHPLSFQPSDAQVNCYTESFISTDSTLHSVDSLLNGWINPRNVQLVLQLIVYILYYDIQYLQFTTLYLMQIVVNGLFLECLTTVD